MARKRCVTCDEPIRFMQSTASGHAIPIDLSPDAETGTIRIHRSGTADGKATTIAEPLKGPALLAAQADAEMLFMDHRATCSGPRTHTPMPDAVRAIRDALPTPSPTPRRRLR